MKYKKKILIIGDFCYPNYSGGSSKHIYDLIQNYPKDKTNIVLITRKKFKNSSYIINDNNAENWYSNYKKENLVIELNKWNLFNPLKYLTQVIKSDIILIEHPIMGIIGSFLGYLSNKKIYYHYHGPIHLEYILKKKTQTKNLIYHILWIIQYITAILSNRIVVHSKYMSSIAKKEHNIKEKKIIYLSAYININNTEIPNIKNEKMRLLIPRRLTQRTGVLLFLQNYLQLPKAFIDKFHITITGIGEDSNNVTKYANIYPDNLTYLGFVSSDTLNTLYAISDSIIVPTIDLEGFGYVILEAFSNGCSALVSKTCGGGYEFIEQELSENYVFDVFSPESIKEKLEFILLHKEDRFFYKKIAEKYSSEKILSEYFNLILS